MPLSNLEQIWSGVAGNVHTVHFTKDLYGTIWDQPNVNVCVERFLAAGRGEILSG